MKTTPMFRIANPRRTTLAHLADATDLETSALAASDPATELPSNTANPRRTMLQNAPVTPEPVVITVAGAVAP
ncbi:hypothetical protein ACIBI4_30350 [Streptomyces sp. NPDC050418]|uniref:hypothetical protein n=1 Tax=Streptomyces sp. NPDC050418 TaxID=3365612 RepID=UPI0037ADA967